MLFLQLLNVFAESPDTQMSNAYWLVDLKQVFLNCRPDEDRMIALIESEQCAALFQHHFRVLDALIPTVARPFADRIASLTISDGERGVDRILSHMADEIAKQLTVIPHREWWFALRGEDVTEASLALKIAYARRRASLLIRNVIENPERRAKIFSSPKVYLAKGISLFRD